MPIACEGNPFKIDNEDRKYIDLVGELWGAFCGGVNGFQLEEKVVSRAQTMFYDTSIASFKAGRFDEPGVKDQALQCCKATGVIARALAEMHGRTHMVEADFRSAGRFIQNQPMAQGAVC